MLYLLVVNFTVSIILCVVYLISLCKGTNVETYKYQIEIQRIELERLRKRLLANGVVVTDDSIIIKKAPRISFIEHLKIIPKKYYRFYEQLQKRINKLPNIKDTIKKSCEGFTLSKTDKVAEIRFRKDDLYVKTNFGDFILPDSGMKVALKPVMIKIKTRDDVMKALELVQTSYRRLTGFYSISITGEDYEI